MKWTLVRWFQYLKKQWIHCGGLAENMYLLTFYIYPFLIPLSFEILCHITSCIFQSMFRKTHVLKISADSQRNVFVKFFLSSLSCWIHHLYIYWKLNPSQMFVTVSRISKIAIRVSCGETNSKVAWEFFAFYNFAKYSIILLLVF